MRRARRGSIVKSDAHTTVVRTLVAMADGKAAKVANVAKTNSVRWQGYEVSVSAWYTPPLCPSMSYMRFDLSEG